MDFTKQELRTLIYQDRLSIDEFDIADPDSIDAVMFDRIEKSEIVELEDAASYILEIFNNAYYITTLILMEKHPALYFRSYLIIAEHAGSAYHDVNEKNTYYRYFESITMAMVWNYLCACWPDTYTLFKKDNSLQKNIWDYHQKKYNDRQWDGDARFLFFNNILNDEEMQRYHVDKYKFIPLHSPEELEAMEKEKQPDNEALILNYEQQFKAFKLQLKKKDDKIAELEQRINDLDKEDEKLDESSPASQKVRLDLLLKLIEKDGADLEKFGNKTKAAEIMMEVTGLPFSTCKNYCSNKNLNTKEHEETILKLNSKLQALGMSIRL